jgi:hypothetical protein
MDQVGYPGIDAETFLLAANGKTPPPEGGMEGAGIHTGSLQGTPTAGFGKTEREGVVGSKKR